MITFAFKRLFMNDSAKTGLVLEGGAMRGLFTAGGATTNRTNQAAFSAITLNMPATRATWACGL